ncbi:hypothetical protein CDEST_11311 [Colletotrichum destructivum]|uniref:Uncharacterized protein n=1 Tax=Colletotrichum destructivum TaxID=34406 RepID=A0AAX4ITB9_9PEZI|nr:hypothetical protein CDEST_11311 [Colletotrichum destructivum]
MENKKCLFGVDVHWAINDPSTLHGFPFYLSAVRIHSIISYVSKAPSIAPPRLRTLPFSLFSLLSLAVSHGWAAPNH